MVGFANSSTIANSVRLQGDDRLPFLRLLLVDAASDWVQGLPDRVAENFNLVIKSFQAPARP